jgi:hypothetical protein
VVNKERKSNAGVRRKKASDTRARGISARQGKEGGARASRRLAGLGPSGTLGKESGPRAGGRSKRWATSCGLSWAKTEKSNENPFLFLFPIFQSIFKWNFEILFEFSNRAHNTKYYAAT